MKAGWDETLRPTPTPRPLRKIDGGARARIVALACSDPPLGFARWRLTPLAARVLEIIIVDAVSRESVRQVLTRLLAAAPQPLLSDSAERFGGVRLSDGGDIGDLSTAF